MTPEELLTLRSDLVDAWYQSAGCPEEMCKNPICCLPLANIAFQTGLTYDYYQHRYVHKLPTLVSFEEELVLQVIQDLVVFGGISRREILSGMMECPESMGKLLYGNGAEWDRRLRNHADTPTSNAAHILLAKEFLYELSLLALPDTYLDKLKAYENMPYVDQGSITSETLEFARFIAEFASRCSVARKQILSGEIEKWDVYSNYEDFRRMENAQLGDYSTWESLGIERETCLIQDLAEVAVIVIEFHEFTDFSKRTVGALGVLMNRDGGNEERQNILLNTVKRVVQPQEYDRVWSVIRGHVY
jgi:hypothetical protein